MAGFVTPPEERITDDSDPCDIARRWLVRQDVIERVVRGALQFKRETGRDVTIISGYRSPEKQRALKMQGRPAAPVDLSNHTSCPATAVDVRIGWAPTRAMKAILGRVMSMEGLRWGGGSKPDDGGIPSDWNHFDLGPRREQ